jgi:glycosyltransferase involved in cell wall biosynthesis
MAEPWLKVLLVTGPFQVRGSSANTLRLAEGLAAHQIEATIVTPNVDCVAPCRRERLSLQVYPRLHFPVWGRVVRESIIRDLSENRPDLIHVQSWSMHRLGIWLARRLERPYVQGIHGYLPPQARIYCNRQWGRRIITVSETVKSELVGRASLPPELVSVIHAGVEVPASPSAPPILAPDRLPVVGTAGPLEAVKGHVFFLGAAQRVAAARPETEFLIAGAGPEEDNLRRVARDLGLNRNLTFASTLYDFGPALAAMDIFCLPSLRQSLGTIMLEAMALGRPVIATGAGGIYRVIRNNETGLVVPPSDNAALADRILELLNDPVRARAIGEAGRVLVREEFGVERMVAQTAALYREVLASEKVATPTVVV